MAIALASGTAAAEQPSRAKAAPAAAASSLLQETAATQAYVEETWLATLKEDGARHGLAHLAPRIFRTTSGLYYAPDADDRAEMLALRRDAQLAARLAPDYERRSALLLKEKLGRTPTAGELRIAAHLGPTAGARLIEMAARLPNKRAASEMPDLARAHQRLFYDCERECTLADVYAKLAGSPPSVVPIPKPTQSATRKQAGWTTTVVLAVPVEAAKPAMRGGLPSESASGAPNVAMGLGARR